MDPQLCLLSHSSLQIANTLVSKDLTFVKRCRQHNQHSSKSNEAREATSFCARGYGLLL